MWNHRPSRAHTLARPARGSTAPVLVLPAVATTQNGSSPASRSSATAASTAATDSRWAESGRSTRRCAGSKPSTRQARPTEAWVCSDT